jgi:hypothetical protein
MQFLAWASAGLASDGEARTNIGRVANINDFKGAPWSKVWIHATVWARRFVPQV